MRLNKVTTVLWLAFVMLIGLAPATPALAADNDQPASPNLLIGADDSALEVGVWYVQDYQNCGGWGLGDLPATAPDALGLRNKLTAPYYFFIFPYPTPQWTPLITWGNGNAWEEDWKKSTSGGQENFQMDRVDLAYFAGHAAASGFFFGVGGNTHDDCQTTAADASYSWGNLDNDWVGLAACNVLDDPLSNLQNWARAMYGTRLLMGFKTVMSDVDFGVPVGDSIRWGHSMTYAWFRAVDQKLPAGQVARVLAERNDYFGDTYARHNTITDYDNFFHYWTHASGQNNLPPNAAIAGTGAVRGLTSADINGEMPIFMIEPLSTDEAIDRYGTVASAFNLTDTTPITGVVAASGIEAINAVNDLFYSDDGDLIMDQSAGNFQYANSDLMWNQEALASIANTEGMMAVDNERAIAIANSFLLQNALMPSDAFAPIAQQDTIVTAQDPGREPGASAALASEPLRILQEDIANHQVVYSRIITFTPTSASAAGTNQEPVAVQVVGPGAKLMVYVAPQVPVSATAASLLQDSVLGGMGGYRRISQAEVAGTNRPQTTPVLPSETIQTLFNTIEEKVALNYVPLPFESREVISETLSYWEGPIGWSQDQLIPIYILTVESTGDDGSKQVYDVYIPVNETYMAPYAEIETVTGKLLPGETLTLEAADASQTLADLGVHPSLNFTLGSGGDYLYEWYKDDIVEENQIGTGRTISYTVPTNEGEVGKPASIKLILVVRDADSPRGSGSTGIDELTIPINTLFMPDAAKP